MLFTGIFLLAKVSHFPHPSKLNGKNMPQVVTAVTVIAGFLILRFIVRFILQVTFTLLRYLFWIAVLAAILLCVL